MEGLSLTLTNFEDSEGPINDFISVIQFGNDS